MTDRKRLLAEKQRKGAQSEELAKNPTFCEVFQKVEDDILADMLNGRGEDSEHASELRGLHRVRQRLIRSAASGRAAAKELVEKRG